jgi:tRNA pseudouridine55 synthase
MRSQLSGVLTIDKPAGQSSAKTVAVVKKLLGVAKVGHSGTLDPFATGVLVCCINQATRLARFFLRSRKSYTAVLRLGEQTDTQDATGQVVATSSVPQLQPDRLVDLFKQFEGQMMQQPPVYSALKHKGTPLYKLARNGTPIQKPPRRVTISSLRITDVRLPDIEFDVTCSAGTYVRTLCADIGERIGCGGHLLSLRRTASGGFSLAGAVALETLEAIGGTAQRLNLLTPMADALYDMRQVEANPDLLRRIAHGRPLTAAHVPQESINKNTAPAACCGYVKVVDAGNELKAVIEYIPDKTAYDYCCVFH